MGKNTKRVDVTETTALGAGWVKVPKRHTTKLSESEARKLAREAVAPANVRTIKESLLKSYRAMGLSEAEAKIAAGLEEPTLAGIPVSQLLKK